MNGDHLYTVKESLSFIMLQCGEPANTIPFLLSENTQTREGVCVYVFEGDRLRKRLREYPAPDLDAPLIPIKMRAV